MGLFDRDVDRVGDFTVGGDNDLRFPCARQRTRNRQIVLIQPAECPLRAGVKRHHADAANRDGHLRRGLAQPRAEGNQVNVIRRRAEINGQAIVTPTGINVNGGDATIKGAEFSLSARPIRGLDLNLAMSWADPKYDNARVQSFIEFPTYSPTGDVSGNQILRTSKFQATAGARWSQPLRGDTDWFIRGDAKIWLVFW